MTGMHWHRHKVSARHYNEYKKLGKLMPIAVALGGDPIYTYAATAPLPKMIDEMMLAGYIRKSNVRMVKSITNDIYVPSNAEIILEGYVDPSEELILEGPFGDHTGYYSLADYYPKFHVTCITHKKKCNLSNYCCWKTTNGGLLYGKGYRAHFSAYTENVNARISRFKFTF